VGARRRADSTGVKTSVRASTINYSGLWATWLVGVLMKIAVVGVGAIGGYVGIRLALAGEDVTFIARGANLQALRSNGLRLERIKASPQFNGRIFVNTHPVAPGFKPGVERPTMRDFLCGVEYEFPGSRFADPDALHCFISKRFAPGYIGWLTQSPTGIQAGLAIRHDPARARVPDIDGFLLRVGIAGGLPRHLKPGHARAGLIPCSGPVFDMARDRAILTGDAAGIVSPVTAGGIHSAWEHGWAVGRAIASSLRDCGSAPEQIAIEVAPRFRTKRALRWAYDRLQFDWPLDLLLHSPPLRWAAEQVYFHKRRV